MLYKKKLYVLVFTEYLICYHYLLHLIFFQQLRVDLGWKRIHKLINYLYIDYFLFKAQ